MNPEHMPDIGYLPLLPPRPEHFSHDFYYRVTAAFWHNEALCTMQEAVQQTARDTQPAQMLELRSILDNVDNGYYLDETSTHVDWQDRLDDIAPTHILDMVRKGAKLHTRMRKLIENDYSQDIGDYIVDYELAPLSDYSPRYPDEYPLTTFIACEIQRRLRLRLNQQDAAQSSASTRLHIVPESSSS